MRSKALVLIIFIFWLFTLFCLGNTSMATPLFRLKWKKYVGKYNIPFTCQPLIFRNYVLHATNGDKNDKKDTYDKLYVFNKNGQPLWNFKGINDINGAIASSKIIVVTDENDYIYALSWNGKLLWKLRVKKLAKGIALGDLNGDGVLDVVVGSDDSYIYALSGRDGSLLWKFGTGNKVWSSPALGDLNGDGVLDVVVGSSDHYIYALSGRDGSLLWKFGTRGYITSSPAVGDLNGDGVLDVVVGSWDHYIYALSGRDGSLLWKFKTGGWVNSSPTLGDLDGNGYIDMAIASFDGYLYVFEATKRSGDVVWSRWHGDAAGTGVYENAVLFAKANLSGNAFAWDIHKRNITSSTKPPYLKILFVKLFDENKNRLFEAGEKGRLIVKIANYGKGNAYNLKLKAISPIFQKTLFINEIRPGEVITKEIDFTVPVKMKTGKGYAEVFLDAGKYSPKPVKIAFAIQGLLPPKFKLTYKVDDDMVGASAGNGNGIIEPRETIELVVKVTNIGKGEARGVNLILTSPDVDVIKGIAQLGNIPSGASATGRLIFFVPGNITKNKIRFTLKIEEALGLFNASTQLVLNVREEGEKVYNYATGYGGGAIIVEGELSRGASLTPSLEIEKTSTSKVSCIRQNPDYYFFGVVVYHYATLPDLDYVKNDEKLIKKLATCYMGVPEDNMKILENPSYALLKRELRDFVRRIKKKDSIFYFYYSGHGLIDSRGVFYILPSDASIEDEEILRESGIDLNSLKRLLSKARGKKIAFFDACRIKPRWKPAVMVYKPKLSDIAIIFSTKQDQISNADREGRYSAFTRALYEMAKAGIINVDMDDDGYVEIKELEKPLIKWIKRISADENQSPDFWGPREFPVFPVE